METIVINTEKPQPAPTETPVPENQVQENAEQTKVEPQSQHQEKVEVANQQPDNSNPVAQDDEVKQFIEKLSAAYVKHGSVKPLLEAMSNDYVAMDDLAIARLDLQKQYPNVKGDRFERMFKREVLDRYSQGEGFDEEDVELGKEMLKKHADQTRSKLIEDQKQFIEPKINFEEIEAKRNEVKKKYHDYVNNSDFTKKLNESKIVAINDGDGGAVNVGVDPQKIVDATINNDLIFEQFKDGKGGVDWDFWGEVMAHIFNRTDFKKAMGEHYGSKGVSKKVTSELRNSTVKVLEQQGRTPEGGSGDFKQKLLAALQQQAKK